MQLTPHRSGNGYKSMGSSPHAAEEAELRRLRKFAADFDAAEEVWGRERVELLEELSRERLASERLQRALAEGSKLKTQLERDLSLEQVALGSARSNPLKSRTFSLQKEAEALREQSLGARDAVGAQQMELRAANAELQSVRDLNEQLKHFLKEKEVRVESLSKEIGILREELESSRREAKAAAAKLSASAARAATRAADAVRADHEKAREMRDAVKARDALAAQVAELQAALKQKGDELFTTRRSIRASADAAADSTARERAAAAEAVASLRADVEAMAQEGGALEANAASLRSALRRERADRTRLAADVARAEEALRIKSEEIRAVREETERRVLHERDLRIAAEGVVTRLERALRANKESSFIVSAREEELSALKDKISTLEAELRACRADALDARRFREGCPFFFFKF